MDLVGAQRRRRVGGEERVSGAAGEDHRSPLLEMADRAPPDERLGDRPDLDRGLDARRDGALLERVLQRQGVDHRRQHPHVVAGDAVDSLVAGGDAADDVAAADHDRELDAEAVDVGDLVGDPETTPASMPKLCEPIRASPESLSRTRL